MRASRLGFDALLLAAVLLFAVLSFGFEAQAGQVPFVAGVLAGGMLLVQIVLDLRAAPAPAVGGAESAAEATERPAGSGEEPAEAGWRAPLFTTLALTGFIFLVWLVGYLIAVPVLTFGAMVLIGRTHWRTAAVVTAAVWAFVFVLMELVLQVNLL